MPRPKYPRGTITLDKKGEMLISVIEGHQRRGDDGQEDHEIKVESRIRGVDAKRGALE